MSGLTRLTAKHQITVPRHVRQLLGIKAGDYVEFVVRGDKASLRKTTRVPDEVLLQFVQSHAMRDWDTPEDDEAFRDL